MFTLLMTELCTVVLGAYFCAVLCVWCGRSVIEVGYDSSAYVISNGTVIGVKKYRLDTYLVLRLV